MKKIIIGGIAAFLLLVFGAVIIIAIMGYRMFDEALKSKSLSEAAAEIREQDSFTQVGELPKTYIDAIIAVEDHRFERHSGIDPIALCRAMWHNILAGKLVEGGSTITQQLAKNMYFTQEKSFIRKVAEAFMALKIESEFSKSEILELYVNVIYFGDGYYNVKDACGGYFGKEPSEMNDCECTMLAGIPNAPSVYAPTENPDLARKRQEHVVEQMVKYGYISSDEGEEITTEAVCMAYA